MRRAGAALIAAVFALAGCKTASDTKPTGRDPFGIAARNKNNKDAKDNKDSKDAKDGKAPAWLDSVAKGPAGNTDVPRSGSWTDDPRSPNFNAKAAAQDAVGGKVVDTFNRPVKDAFIRVEGVNDAPGAAALGIQTDGSGYFFSRGLKPGQTYNLTAEVTQDGKQFVGSVQTRVPNPILLITLREDLGGRPPVGNAGGTGTGGLPPTPSDKDHIPPMGLGPAGGSPRPRDGDAFRPDAGSTRSLPPSIDGSPTTRPTPPPTPGAIPDPEDITLPPGVPSRPENIADGPKTNPFTPPPVSVPGPPSLPTYPLPPASPPGGAGGASGSGGAPAPKLSSLPKSAGNFRLLDSLERYWDFSTDRAGSVVLVEFVTTACPHCKPAVPVLKDMQSRYGASGFQVVAVLCDEVPLKQRAEAAGKYARDNNVNYAVFVEPGTAPGDVRDRFAVEGYPTAVLLDAGGGVLWKGHPVVDKVKLDAAIKKALGK
jgi:thiol-disulfide isomerase/thioredoxin